MRHKKILKFAAFNLAFALAVIILFSPGLVGLGFTGSAFWIALSAAVAVTSAALFVMVNKNFLQSAKSDKLLNVSESSWGMLNEELFRYGGSKVLRSIATDAQKQITRYSETVSNYKRLLEKKFSAESLSFTKFIAVLQNMEEVIKKNITCICNRCAVFNEKDYLSLKDYKNDNIDDAIQEERIDIYKKSLAWMCTLLEENEKLLFGLDKLMLEVSNTEFRESDTEQAADQINQLIEQLKYYEK